MPSNRPLLAELREMGLEAAAALPLADLALLLEDVAAAKADAKALEEKLRTALDRRYRERAAALRSATGKDTGRVSLDEGEYVVRADLPKSVIWDQAKLREALDTLDAAGVDVRELVQVEVKVPEGKYQAWPSSLRKQLEPARTVVAGRPRYEIERRDDAQEAA